MSENLIKVDEFKELSLQIDSLIDKSNVFMQIFTRGADPNANSLVNFKVFNDTKLAKLAENMPEINRATNVFGKQNSQATSKLMTLNMISQSPYRRLKQCLAQIERKRGALKENIFKLRKDKVEIDKLLYKKSELEKQINCKSPQYSDSLELEFDLRLLEIEIQEKATNISDANLYIEGALKEIGIFQETYNDIKKSFNIPEAWDEEDYENAEIEEHVKTAFLHTIRDVEMTGRLNVGTHEYLEQYGINPHTAYKLVLTYLSNVEEMSKNNQFANIEVLYDFLDKMYDVFKDEYKHAMDRIGLKSLISKEYLYLEEPNEIKSE